MRLLRRSWAVLRGKWLHCAVAGVLVNTVLLDPAHVAMTRMNAAPIALIQTLNPLLTAVLAWPLLGERLLPRQVLGLVLGTAGVALIVGLAAARSTVQLDLALLSGLGVLGLVAGTLYFARFCRGVPMLEGATVQFLAAAVAGALAVLLFETPHADWTARGDRGDRVERGRGLAGQHGAVSADAAARLGGAGDGEFLPGAGRGGAAGLGAAGRGAVGADRARPGGVLGRLLAGAPAVGARR